MRPVNLIPGDHRRDGDGSKAIPIPYFVIGALVLALIGVTAVTLQGKGISGKQAEIAALEVTEAQTSARAQSLSSFVAFQDLTTGRATTVAALAQSRFDWERVIRELTLVLPNRVWLTSLIGTVSPAVSTSSGQGVALRAEIEGPALELVGCAASQRDVASLISALGDIDGVTRVTAGRSEKQAPTADSGSASASGDSEDCRTRNFITKFEIVAAFDAVAVPAGAIPTADAGAVAAATPATPEAGSAGTDASAQGGTSDGSTPAQPADGSAQAQPADGSAQAQPASDKGGSK